MHVVQIHGRMIFVREDRDDFDLNPNKGQGDPSDGRSASRPNDSGLLEQGTRLFVSNLNPMTTWTELKDYCKTCGTVTFANVFKVRFASTLDVV